MIRYTTLATSQSPALVIYLLDVSKSMAQPMGGRRRIDVVMDAVNAVFRQMVFRSTKGTALSARYRIAMLAYSDQVYDLLGGIRRLDEVVQLGVPELNPWRTSDMAAAFARAEELLQAELANLSSCPAPLVCHMTDGEYTGRDPRPIAERIMQIALPDGQVLVENIFIDDSLPAGTADIRQWPGIQPGTTTAESVAFLAAISSRIPESYRQMMRENQYQLAPGALMLFPGGSPEMVALGFQMSAATPVR